MVDTFSKTERSRIMSRVKSKNNKSTELGFISIIKEKKQDFVIDNNLFPLN